MLPCFPVARRSEVVTSTFLTTYEQHQENGVGDTVQENDIPPAAYS